MDDPIADRHTGLVFEVGAVDHVRDTVREGSTRLGPLYEFTGGRPGVIGRGGTDNQTEMACTQGRFVDLRPRSGLTDASNRLRLADVVDLADECRMGR